MANPEHLKILKQGVEVWNKWRETNPEIKPDLREANLKGIELRGLTSIVSEVFGSSFSETDEFFSKLPKTYHERAKLFETQTLKYATFPWGINLSKVDFTKANLSEATLHQADLSDAILREADLQKADLRETNLSRAYLGEANLSGAKFNRANLYSANLSGANLCRANLSNANLEKAELFMADLAYAVCHFTNFMQAQLHSVNLCKANLSGVFLSGATIDENTLNRSKAVIGVTIGVNGIWSETFDSAALMKFDPPGNSMQGSNPEAVLESLKRARALHNYSLTLVGIALLIAVLGLNEIKLPFLTDVKVSPIRYVLLAMPISVGILSLVKLFMEDSLNGARYLHDRKSAMLVGNFPWAISKFAGVSGLNKVQSLFTRLTLTFHPIVYLYY